jgi:hypothetical protein
MLRRLNWNSSRGEMSIYVAWIMEKSSCNLLHTVQISDFIYFDFSVQWTSLVSCSFEWRKQFTWTKQKHNLFFRASVRIKIWFRSNLRTDLMLIILATTLSRISSSRLLSKNIKIRIHKTIILPVNLYGCETCSLKLSKECRLWVFENRGLMRIFGPRRKDVAWGW